MEEKLGGWGIGDGGLGIGDWGLGIGPNPQSPIPHPQTPIPHPPSPIVKKFKLFNKFNSSLYKLIILIRKLFIFIYIFNFVYFFLKSPNNLTGLILILSLFFIGVSFFSDSLLEFSCVLLLFFEFILTLFK